MAVILGSGVAEYLFIEKLTASRAPILPWFLLIQTSERKDACNRLYSRCALPMRPRRGAACGSSGVFTQILPGYCAAMLREWSFNSFCVNGGGAENGESLNWNGLFDTVGARQSVELAEENA